MALVRMRSFSNFENRRIKGINSCTAINETDKGPTKKATAVAPYFFANKINKKAFFELVYILKHRELRGSSLSVAGCIKALFNQSAERTRRLRNDSLTEGSRVFSVEEAGARRLKRATHEYDVITANINPQQIRPTNS